MRTQILLSCVILLGLLAVPAFAQQVTAPKNLDHPGIKWDWKIKAENYTFDVSTVSNYDMKNVMGKLNNLPGNIDENSIPPERRIPRYFG